MSFWGRFNDLISGQPAGSTDASAAQGAAADAGLEKLNQQELDAGKLTQDQFDQRQAGIDAEAYTDSPFDIAAVDTGAGIVGAAEAATDPVQVLKTGLEWEGQTVGNVAGGVANAASKGLKDALLGTAKQIPWYVWVAAAFGIFIWLGGGAFLERKARARLST